MTCYISPDNHKKLRSLHKFCNPNTKLKKFKENITAISIYSSSAIFIGRTMDETRNNERPFSE